MNFYRFFKIVKFLRTWEGVVGGVVFSILFNLLLLLLLYPGSIGPLQRLKTKKKIKSKRWSSKTYWLCEFLNFTLNFFGIIKFIKKIVIFLDIFKIDCIIIMTIIIIPSGVKFPRVKSKVKSKRKAEVVTPRR